MTVVCSLVSCTTRGEKDNCFRHAHPFHQHQLGLAHHGLICSCSLLSEDSNELLQTPLLYIRRHVVLQPVIRPGFLRTDKASAAFQQADNLRSEPCLTSRWTEKRLFFVRSCTHLSHAVSKQEAYVVADFPQQGHGLLVIFFCLPAETRNEITAQTHSCPKDTDLQLTRGREEHFTPERTVGYSPAELRSTQRESLPGMESRTWCTSSKYASLVYLQ